MLQHILHLLHSPRHSTLDTILHRLLTFWIAIPHRHHRRDRPTDRWRLVCWLWLACLCKINQIAKNQSKSISACLCFCLCSSPFLSLIVCVRFRLHVWIFTKIKKKITIARIESAKEFLASLKVMDTIVMRDTTAGDDDELCVWEFPGAMHNNNNSKNKTTFPHMFRSFDYYFVVVTTGHTASHRIATSTKHVINLSWNACIMLRENDNGAILTRMKCVNDVIYCRFENGSSFLLFIPLHVHQHSPVRVCLFVHPSIKTVQMLWPQRALLWYDALLWIGLCYNRWIRKRCLRRWRGERRIRCALCSST